MKPEWCPQWAWDVAIRVAEKTVDHGWMEDWPAVYHIARALLDAHQRGKHESKPEIDRLNKVIERMQQTMSSQAEQWTRSMAKARREGMEEAADMIDHGFEKPVGKPYRPDGIRSKHDQCPHGRYMYEDCEDCCSNAIRAKAQEAAKEGE